MSKRASPAVVGIFVIAGIVLAVIAVAIIGGGRFFRNTTRVIVYFDSSVSGLRLGAPVKFRGIEIGTVENIRINMSGAMLDPGKIRIPVILELDVDRVTSQGVRGVDLRSRAEVQALVDRGLRAKLATESFVTGLRYVSLDVEPAAPAVLVNDAAVRYPEIPSVRGAMEDAPEKLDAVLDKLAELDLDKISESIQLALDDAHKLLSSPHLTRAVSSLDGVTRTLERTIANLETSTRALDPVIQSAHRMVAPDGTLSTQVDTTLKELAAAARSMRRLADQISRDPGSMLRGGRP